MAYNDDSVLARLSSLNESHDSIATAAQWIMFHRYVLLLSIAAMHQ
jgi:regulator of Ty1 transposition protein 103